MARSAITFLPGLATAAALAVSAFAFATPASATDTDAAIAMCEERAGSCVYHAYGDGHTTLTVDNGENGTTTIYCIRGATPPECTAMRPRFQATIQSGVTAIGSTAGVATPSVDQGQPAPTFQRRQRGWFNRSR